MAPTLRERILAFVNTHPGRTDREITNEVCGRGKLQQLVNQECRRLQGQCLLVRRKRGDGLIGNYPAAAVPSPSIPPPRPVADATDDSDPGSEEIIKLSLDRWLRDQGWETEIAWDKSRGIDIRATRGGRRWVIEVKGEGSSQPMRVNFFLHALGESLQRMDDPAAMYSIALPDLPQFRALWARLPALAKTRTGLTALFVRRDGKVLPEAAVTYSLITGFRPVV